MAQREKEMFINTATSLLPEGRHQHLCARGKGGMVVVDSKGKGMTSVRRRLVNASSSGCVVAAAADAIFGTEGKKYTGTEESDGRPYYVDGNVEVIDHGLVGRYIVVSTDHHNR